MIDPALWTSRHVAGIASGAPARAPLITASQVVPAADGLDVWDAWPVQDPPGRLWMALAAPRFTDPDERHGHARIHLFERQNRGWQDLGPAMPDGFSPGSREWSGSTVLDPQGRTLTLYFTAAGRRGEASLTFEQRLFSAEATLVQEPDTARCIDWRNLREIVSRDPDHYMTTEGGTGAPGTIKAFRDPFYFHDAADRRHYLLFAGSRAGSASSFNGVVGIATATTGVPLDWQILPPIISADGLNNELERPHVVYHRGLYYVFWSTQEHVFNPAAAVGPTGLYGMVSPRMLGGWEPLNGTGLVFSNPTEAPAQAYSWLVLPDLSVTSFIDRWGIDASSSSPPRFGGTFAPFLRLQLEGAKAELID